MLLVLWNSGSANILLAALIFSLSTVCVKLLSASIPVFQVVCLPSAVCWLATSVVVAWKKENLHAKASRDQLLTLLRGLFGAATLVLYFYSVELLEVKDAVTLFFCSPAIAAVLEWGIGAETLLPAGIFGSLSTIVGVLFITQPNLLPSKLPNIFNYEHAPLPADSAAALQRDPNDSTPMQMSTLGVVLAVSAACTNAASFVTIRALQRAMSALALTWWYHTIVIIVSVVPLLARYPAAPVVPSSIDAFLLLLIAAAQLVGQLLLNRGFQLTNATRGSAINVFQVLFAYVWDIVLLHHEDLTVQGIIGALFVVAGVVLIALPQATLPRYSSVDGCGGQEGGAHEDEKVHMDPDEQDVEQHGGLQKEQAAAQSATSCMQDDLRQPLL